MSLIDIIRLASFLELPDTPTSYLGANGFIVRVNATGDGLEFVDASTIETGTAFLENTLCSKDGGFYYFGGDESASGDWKINRYPTGDVDAKESATEAANISFATLAAAWPNRTTLSYT